MSALGQKQTCAPQNVMSALPPIATSIAFFGMSALGRFCCKSRSALVIKNSAGYGSSFRVRMLGTSSAHVKLTGEFGNAIEAIRIGDCFSFRVFAKNSQPCNSRLLQQNRPVTEVELP